MNESRTYSIPFEKVWVAASSLAGGVLKRWTIISRDDIEGLIKAESRTFLTGGIKEVTIRITLDENAQTQVDIESESKRRVTRFVRALDRRLQNRPGK